MENTIIRIGILTASDRSYRGERPDLSGPALRNAVNALGWQVAWEKILPDEAAPLTRFLIHEADTGSCDLILTTGGTGFAPRDVTPEATLAAIERVAPGLAEAIRTESIKLTPHGMLSRGVAGIRGRTLIVNLSGSPKAAVEQLHVISPAIPHAISLLRERPDAEAGHRQPRN